MLACSKSCTHRRPHARTHVLRPPHAGHGGKWLPGDNGDTLRSVVAGVVVVMVVVVMVLE